MLKSKVVKLIENEECKKPTDNLSIEIVRKEDPRFSAKHDPLRPTKTKKVLEQRKHQADEALSDGSQFDNQSDTT